MKHWTKENIPDLSGKIMIVTGGNSGIGYHMVKELSAKGALVILASRNIRRGETAKDAILSIHPDARISVVQLDLADLQSVKHFASGIQKEYRQIDVLINNAGIMMSPYQLTADGFESQMGINHLGHFALTGLLLRRIMETRGARIVNISSGGHRFGRMDFSNLLFTEGRDYSPIRAYARSKLANLLFTYELDRRFKRSGTDTLALAAHPGVAKTNLGRYFENKPLVRFMMPVWNLMSQSAAMGALPGIRAVVDPKVRSREYYGPAGFREQRGYPVVVGSSKASQKEDDAEKLWEMSEALTGIHYRF